MGPSVDQMVRSVTTAQVLKAQPAPGKARVFIEGVTAPVAQHQPVRGR
jgi:hypothetical protein